MKINPATRRRTPLFISVQCTRARNAFRITAIRAFPRKARRFMVHTVPLASLLFRAVHGASMHHRNPIRAKHLRSHHTLLHRSERSQRGLAKLFTPCNATHRLAHRCCAYPSAQALSAHIIWRFKSVPFGSHHALLSGSSQLFRLLRAIRSVSNVAQSKTMQGGS